MKKDVAALSSEPEALAPRRSLLPALGISLLAALVLIAVLSMQPVVEVEVLDDEGPGKLSIARRPPPLKDGAMLMNYDAFVDTYRLAEAMSELNFLANMMDIAQHNLATLSGEDTYYKRQSPFKLKLADKYKHHTWADVPANLLGGDLQADEGAVSQPAAELKRTNIVSKWFQGFTKREADFEIPNLPLEQQPNPERVTHIDADLRACLNGIKDQARCGACYAFSWLSLAEWHYCRQLNNGQLADFSEQHIVDCGHVARLRGCVEGKLTDARDFSQVFGIHWERDYPYTSKQAACKRQQGELSVKVNDFKRIKVERGEFERTLLEQPILLEVHLPEDINSYSSGIHPGHNCDAQLGHGMLLIGHGRQEGKPYWLLRNSLGRRWGENGYLRISREMPDMAKCFKSAFVAKFKFKSLPEENYVDFYDSLQFEPSLDHSRAQANSMRRLLAGN